MYLLHPVCKVRFISPLLLVCTENNLICKRKDRCITHDQLHTYDTRSSSDYCQHVHKLVLYNSKSILKEVPTCIKQIKSNCL
jgi:hypothetical protein